MQDVQLCSRQCEGYEAITAMRSPAHLSSPSFVWRCFGCDPWRQSTRAQCEIENAEAQSSGCTFGEGIAPQIGQSTSKESTISSIESIYADLSRKRCSLLYMPSRAFQKQSQGALITIRTRRPVLLLNNQGCRMDVPDKEKESVYPPHQYKRDWTGDAL